jgi:hypothetical protein
MLRSTLTEGDDESKPAGVAARQAARSTWITHLLHNQIILNIQQRLRAERMPMVILLMQAPL